MTKLFAILIGGALCNHLNDGVEHGETIEWSTTPTPSPTPSTTPSYGCWHCDATNWQSCFLIGEYKTCGENQVCMTEIRERNGVMFSVCSMCKDRKACHAQRANNFVPPVAQCRPRNPDGPSCCRQCCEFDRCTDNYNPATPWGWRRGPVEGWKNFNGAKATG